VCFDERVEECALAFALRLVLFLAFALAFALAWSLAWALVVGVGIMSMFDDGEENNSGGRPALRDRGLDLERLEDFGLEFDFALLVGCCIRAIQGL
jgi:hypothetical protein